MKYLLNLLAIISTTLVFPQGIQMSLSTDSITLAPGQSQQITINITPSGGFNQQIFLYQSCSGNCSGISLSFSSNPVNYPYTCNFTLNVGGNANNGQSDFLIIGYNGPAIDTAILHLEVSPNNCVFTQLATLFNIYYCILSTQNGVWLGGNSFDNYGGPGILTNWGSQPFPGYVYNLTEDSMQNLWLTTDQGVAKFDGTYWSVFNTTNSIFTTQNFSSVAVDSSNNIWVTTTLDPYGIGNGIYKYDGTSWVKYDSLNNSMPSNGARSITFDKNGLLWAYFYSFTTHSFELYNYDGNTWTPLNWPYNCVPLTNPTTIVFDSQNNAWFGTGDGIGAAFPNIGLIKYNGSTVELWSDSILRPINHYIYDASCNIILSDSTSQIPSMGIHNVFIDHSDRIWVATIDEDHGKGIVLIDGNNFTLYNHSNSLLGYDAANDFSQSNDTIYILTDFAFWTGGFTNLVAYTCGSIISLTSSIEKQEINIYPNPSNGQFKIDVPENLSMPATIKIFSLTGQLVYESVLNNSDVTVQLNVADGFYHFTLENDDVWYTGKFVISGN